MGISDEIEDATIAVDETTILEIESTIQELLHSDKILASQTYEIPAVEKS